MKKITFSTILLVLFSTATISAADVVLNNFESGSPTVTTKYGHTYVNAANALTTGLNTTANCGKIGRTSANWYELIYFPASFTVPANTTKYVHIMVNYAAQPDISIRVDAATAGADGATDIRAINKYTDFGQWQDLVFAIAGGTGGKTVIQLNYLADLGFNNTPSGRILNNTDKFGYLDEVIVSDDAHPRGHIPFNSIYNFEPGTGVNTPTVAASGADANNTVTYPFANPFVTGINTSNNVCKRTAVLANPALWYTGLSFTLPNAIIIDATHRYLHVMISVPVNGQKVGFDLKQGSTKVISDNQATITTANTWQDVVLDISTLTPTTTYISQIVVKCGNFNASSTAAGDYYFDEIYIDGSSAPRTNITTGLNKTIHQFNVYAVNKGICIDNVNADNIVTIYNVSGQKVFDKRISNKEVISMEKGGLYLVKIANQTTKVIVK